MDDTLRIIQHLYDEVEDPSFEQRLAEDESLRQEYEALAATKEALDERAAPSPDEAVVDQLVATAAEATQDGGNDQSDRREAVSPAEDREARAPSRGWSRRLQGASAALAVLLVAGIAWLQLGDPLSMGTTASPTGSEEGAPATSTNQPAARTAGTLDNAASTDTEVPEWDDQEELVQIYRRIERLQSRSTSDAWGSTDRLVQQSQP